MISFFKSLATGEDYKKKKENETNDQNSSKSLNNSKFADSNPKKNILINLIIIKKLFQISNVIIKSQMSITQRLIKLLKNIIRMQRK